MRLLKRTATVLCNTREQYWTCIGGTNIKFDVKKPHRRNTTKLTEEAVFLHAERLDWTLISARAEFAHSASIPVHRVRTGPFFLTLLNYLNRQQPLLTRTFDGLKTTLKKRLLAAANEDRCRDPRTSRTRETRDTTDRSDSPVHRRLKPTRPFQVP